MIVIEGPDAAGKTTLAHRLADEFDLEYTRPPEAVLSSTAGPGDGLVAWWTKELRWNQALPFGTKGNRIYDRCTYISECIYASVMHREPIEDGPNMGKGIHDLWVLDPLLIFCLPPWEAQAGILHNLSRERLEGAGEAQHKAIAWVYWCYMAMWGEMTTHVLVWDYTNEAHYDRLKQKVGEYLGWT